jgi:hypothetical protein
MRYNTMKGYPEKSWTGYYAGPNNDSCYGNIIWGTGRGLRVDQEEQLASGYLYILNNTVYDVDDYFYAQELSAVGSGTTVIKYNVFYKAGSSPWIQLPNWSSGPSLEIDYNIYYDSPVSNFSASLTGCGSSRTLTQWRACGYDIHSDTVNPGLADPAGGDFSRPGASGEMSLNYGGRDWTIFGAVQPAGEEATTKHLKLRKP